MTTDQQPAPGPVVATAAPGSRLEQLLAQYETAKAAAEEATHRFEAITLAIKGELTGEHPNQPLIMLSGAPGLPHLVLRWRSAWRLDSKRLKAELPETYVQYAVQGGNWELRRED